MHLLGGDLDAFQRLDSAFTLQALGSPGKSEKAQRGATKKLYSLFWELLLHVEAEVLHANRR